MVKCLCIAALSLGLVVGCTPKDETTSGGGQPEAAAGAKATPAAGDLEKIAAAGPVEIGCALCIFGVTEGVTACPPAVKLGDTVLLLTGYEAEEHALCKAAKKATVEGKVEGGKFVATKVELVPEAE